MAYIGNKPTVGNFQICDAISVVNNQAAYTMQVGSVNVIPQSSNHMIVSLNGTIQKPGGANPSFTVSGSTITFAANLVTGDVINFIQILGDVLDLGVPSDGTVTAAKLNNDIISGTTALTSEPADTDEFLVSDAGTLKRIDYSLIKGGGITEADQWRLTANLSGNNFITSNLERSDTYGAGYIGTGMSQSSGVFTFPSTGIWKVEFNPNYRLNGNTRVIEAKIYTTPDNSTYNVAAYANTFIQQTESNETAASTYLQINFDVTNTSNDKVKFYSEYTNQSTLMKGSTSGNWTTMTFTRLGDT